MIFSFFKVAKEEIIRAVRMSDDRMVLGREERASAVKFISNLCVK